jgi:two-component system response regulator
MGDEGERVFVENAIVRAEITNPVRFVRTDCEAFGYLAEAGVRGDRSSPPVPFLMVLDLRLPPAGGLEVLRWVRRRPEFNAMVVVALSSSDLAGDIQATAVLGANSCVCRPSTPEDLIGLMKAIKGFWIDINCLAEPVPAVAPAAFHI